jgi:hypothetical protein
MDIKNPTRLVTSQQVIQKPLHPSVLPEALTPRFKNNKLNNGTYKIAHENHENTVYVYDFGERNTTPANQATYDSLELESVIQLISIHPLLCFTPYSCLVSTSFQGRGGGSKGSKGIHWQMMHPMHL